MTRINVPPSTGGGGATDWIGQQLAHAQTLNPSLALVAWQVSGFATWVGSPLAAPGQGSVTGASSLISTDDGGVIRLTTTASASTSCTLSNNPVGVATGKPIVSNVKTRPWYIAYRVRPGTVDSLTLQLVGMQAAAATSWMGVVGTGRTVNGTVGITNANWILNAGGTFVDTGQALDTTNFHDVTTWNDPTVKVVGYYDRVEVARTTTLTGISTNVAWPSIYMENNLTAAARTMDVVACCCFTALP